MFNLCATYRAVMSRERNNMTSSSTRKSTSWPSIPRRASNRLKTRISPERVGVRTFAGEGYQSNETAESQHRQNIGQGD